MVVNPELNRKVDKLLTKDNPLSQPGGLGGLIRRVLNICFVGISTRRDRQCHFPNSLFGAGTRHWRADNVGKEIAVKKFLKLFKNESGASAAEYALILAIVGAAIAIAAINLGGAISSAMNRATTAINSSGTAAGAGGGSGATSGGTSS